MRNSAESLGDVPERNVNALRFQNQMELVGLLFDPLHFILSQVHQAIHVCLEPGITLSAPLKPQLENVIMTSTLNDFIASVILNIIEFVLNGKKIEKFSRFLLFFTLTVMKRYSADIWLQLRSKPCERNFL